MILFWAIPVAAVGAISNINYLTSKVPFLSFINDIPSVVLGVVTGLLPAILTSLLMALVPVFLRCKFKLDVLDPLKSLTRLVLAKTSGAVSRAQIELQTQISYFVFLLIQVFLITTISSSAAAVAAQIAQQPTIVPQLLAKNLPKSSNFFISFIILQGLSVPALKLLQAGSLIKVKILGPLFDKTPRKKWIRWFTLSNIGWGTIFPLYTNLAVIGITYSAIAPLILLFMTLAMTLLWLAFKYLFIYVFDYNVDTKGQLYPRALKQLLLGVYIGEVCLLGLFSIRATIGPIILMVILLVFTVIYNIIVHRKLKNLLLYIPQDMLLEARAENRNGLKTELSLGVEGKFSCFTTVYQELIRWP